MTADGVGRRLRLAFGAGALLLFLAGCGESDDGQTGLIDSGGDAASAVVAGVPAAEAPVEAEAGIDAVVSEPPTPVSAEPADPAPAQETPAAPETEEAPQPQAPAEAPAPGEIDDADATNDPIEAPPLATEEADLDPEMLALIEAGDVVAGRTYATRCASCHALDPGGLAPAAAQLGPSLYGMFGARIGAAGGFDYSPVFRAMYETAAIWTAARLDAFLSDPAGTAPGTTMTSGAISDPEDRANVIAFIRSLAVSPLPIEGGETPAATEGNPELLAMIAEADDEQGRALAARCSGCHRFGEDEPALIGPNLYDIVGAAIGGKEGFVYSPALRTLNEAGEIWTYDRLDAFLESPAAAIPGTRMGFGGVDDIRERAAIIAYLRELATEPYPLQVDVGTEIGVAREGLQPVVFTAAQVEDGALGYGEWCADCHGQNLRGEVDLRAEGFGVSPPLTGPNFEHRWFAGTVGRLFSHVSRDEPNDAPGALTLAAYAEILAFVLERNGFRPGPTPFPSDLAVLENMGFFQE